MSLVTIAEILVGETLVSPGGPVDGGTAVADDNVLWQSAGESLTAEREDDHEVAAQEEFALV
jgi:hypothetical protein